MITLCTFLSSWLLVGITHFDLPMWIEYTAYVVAMVFLAIGITLERNIQDSIKELEKRAQNEQI